MLLRKRDKQKGFNKKESAQQNAPEQYEKKRTTDEHTQKAADNPN